MKEGSFDGAFKALLSFLIAKRDLNTGFKLPHSSILPTEQ